MRLPKPPNADVEPNNEPVEGAANPVNPLFNAADPDPNVTRDVGSWPSVEVVMLLLLLLWDLKSTNELLC